MNMDSRDAITERSRGNLLCNTCQQGFEFMSQLRQHESSHNGQFKCTKCPVTFKEYSDLVAHTKLKHQAQARPSPATPAKTTHRSKSTSSKKKATKQSRSLMPQVKDPNPMKSGRQHEDAQVDKSSYICQYCQKGFRDKYRLKGHMDYHTGLQILCPVTNCPYRSTKKLCIKNHIERVHTEHKSNSCPHCPASFKHAYTLEKHVKLHSGVNEYLTEYSGGEVVKKQAFSCGFCEKDCRSSENLEIHIRGHTGEKPFPCPVLNCPYRSKRPNIGPHISRVHTEKKKYGCSQCSASFGARSRLTLHEAAHVEYESSKSESLMENQ